NNYLASMVVVGDSAGLAYADVTTGEFAATALAVEQAVAELERLAPSQLLLPRDQHPPEVEVRAFTKIDAPMVELKAGLRELRNHGGAVALAAYGCDGRPLAAEAAPAIVAYLREVKPVALADLVRLQSYPADRFMRLATQTMHNLEIFQRWEAAGG